MSEILKQLERITRQGYDAHQVFDDWIAVMFWALQRNDDEYLKIVRRYRNERPRGEREIDHFCHAFGLLLKEMEDTNKELLGELYMTWEVSNKYAGQFFTPWPIAEMMAKMLSPHGRILDPCCGSGVMLIAAAKNMTAEQCAQSLFVGQDIDFTCVMMCALNLTFFNLNGYVILGNTLMMETRRVFQTTRSYMGGGLREIPVPELKPEEKAMLEEARKTAASTPSRQGKLIQPALF
jgi:type I restriction-modification system DNA methylase subunit